MASGVSGGGRTTTTERARTEARLAALSWMTHWIDPVLLFLASLAVPLLIVQTGETTPEDQAVIIAATWIIWGAFTVNFAVRMLLAPHRRDELHNLAWDLILVAGQPLYTLGPRKADAGMLFILLVVILGRALRKGRVLVRTGSMLRSRPLRVLAFVVPWIWLTAGALVYRFEAGTGTIASFPDGVWWSAVTLATVGYGDISPKSTGGRSVAVATMVVGIGMFSVITAKLAELLFIQRTRGSRHEIVQSDHTLVLGWSPKVFTVVEELVAANASRVDPSIVVLADQDHNDMYEAILTHVPALTTSNTALVCRNGSPGDPASLAPCRPDRARSIIVIDDSAEDASVVRSLLALMHGGAPIGPIPVVAEIDDPATARALRFALHDRVTIVNPTSFVARTTAQACRSASVARAYEALLDVFGSELYVQAVPGTAGLPVGRVVHGFEQACVIGVRAADGTVDLNPPMDHVVAEDDELVLLAVDDSEIAFRLPPRLPEPATAVTAALAPSRPHHVVVFGWNAVGPAIVRELDGFLPPGSRLTVAVDPSLGVEVAPPGPDELVATTITVRAAAGSSYAELVEVLAEEHSDHAIVLCYRDVLTVAEADARALVTTMQVRRALGDRGRETTVVTELLDQHDVALAPPESLGEFIVSDRLVSLLLTQLSENDELAAVFDDLLDPDGAELYAKPADRYLTPGAPTTFGAVVASAAARAECAIGYRVAADAHDSGRRFGVVLNPPKSASLTLAPGDQVLVVAETDG